MRFIKLVVIVFVVACYAFFQQVAFSWADGTIRWAYELSYSEARAIPAIGADGTIYMASCSYKFYAFNPDGTVKWIHENDDSDGGFHLAPLVGPDGAIYTKANDFYAFNPDGTVKWKIECATIKFYPAIGLDGTIYFWTYDGILHAIDNNSGEEKWTLDYSLETTGSPIFVDGDGVIYTWGLGRLYAINPEGTINRSIETGSNHGTCPAVGFDGSMYYFEQIGDTHYPLVAYDKKGNFKWATDISSSTPPVLGEDGTIYCTSYSYASRSTSLYAVNSDGSIKWTFQAGRQSQPPSPAVGADGTIYFGSNNLYAINPDGSQKWELDVGSSVYSSPTIGADGTVYIGTSSGDLYAVNTDCGGPGNTPWPLAHANIQNTSRAKTGKSRASLTAIYSLLLFGI